MRERRTFAERTRVLHSEEPLKKYFLVYEGAETEAIYFNAVNAMKEEARINPLIELVSIDRSYSEEGWSNPKKILNRVIENEKKFCEELYELEWQVGSNVGLLIEDMRKREMQL